MSRVSVAPVVVAFFASIAIAGEGAGQAPAPQEPKPPIDAPENTYFENKIRPILVARCDRCHGSPSGEEKANLRVDSLEALLRGGDSGPAIVPGAPEKSLLILAVRHDGAVSMPPKLKLPQTEIDALTAWVKMGAPWPRYAGKPAVATPHSPPRHWSEKERSFWAFRPPEREPLPPVTDKAWPRSPIDQIILARLETNGLRPAPVAEKRALIRRATLDLCGLPPSTAEIDDFVGDESPAAFARVVDRLLASPRHGERWGRHWLDVARYADSNGMDDNLAYSDAWRYRDYVVASLNGDKPYDAFVAEQIAGDLIAQGDPARHDALVVATGFLALGPKMLAEDDPVKQQMDIVDEQLDTTCRAFLALTMGCARCHDHKFDPIEISDYYAMAGIFKSTRTMLSFRVDSKWSTTALGLPRAAMRLDELQRTLDHHDNALVNGNTNRMSRAERAAHAKQVDDAKRAYAAIPKAMAVRDGDDVGDLEVFLRGNHLTRGPRVPRHFPTILAGSSQPGLGSSQSGRLELARWIADSENPLTAHVIANRLWRWHFGEGIVRSTDNFGKLGEPPSHRDLLDWLATTLDADRWSLKKLHKRIMLSQVYQMSAAWNESAARLDPENRLLWRMPRRRMEAEVLRDALLFVSGELDSRMGGVPMPSEPFENLTATGTALKPDLYQSRRRSVYLPVLRSAVYDVFQAYDFPDPAVSNGDRGTTTVAGQALFLMNGAIVDMASGRMAAGFANDQRRSLQQRLDDLCRQVLGRDMRGDELRLWTDFLARYERTAARAGESGERQARLAWKGLCRALFSSNEFVYAE